MKSMLLLPGEAAARDAMDRPAQESLMDEHATAKFVRAIDEGV